MNDRQNGLYQEYLMNKQFKGTATVELTSKGKHILVFSGDTMQLIKKMVMDKYGRSTKRINKKRFKKYISTLVLEAAKRDIDEFFRKKEE